MLEKKGVWKKSMFIKRSFKKMRVKEKTNKDKMKRKRNY